MIQWWSIAEKPDVEKMVMGKFRDGTMCTVIWEDGWKEAAESDYGIDIWDELDYKADEYINEGWYMLNPSSDAPIPFYTFDIVAWAPLEEFI